MDKNMKEKLSSFLRSCSGFFDAADEHNHRPHPLFHLTYLIDQRMPILNFRLLSSFLQQIQEVETIPFGRSRYTSSATREVDQLRESEVLIGLLYK